MKVKQFIDALKQMPQDTDLVIYDLLNDYFESPTEFIYDRENGQCWFTIGDPEDLEDDDPDEVEEETDLKARGELEAARAGKGNVIDADFTDLGEAANRADKPRRGRSTDNATKG
jgi:hypothetical protein